MRGYYALQLISLKKAYSDKKFYPAIRHELYHSLSYLPELIVFEKTYCFFFTEEQESSLKKLLYTAKHRKLLFTHQKKSYWGAHVCIRRLYK